MFLLILSSFRIGEAQVPGPDTWKLGICNPSGLQGKHHVLGNLDADVMAVSETHLSKIAKRNLSLSFRTNRSHFKHLLTGASTAPRSTASDAGAWSGVAFASSFPCRTIAAPWPDDLFATGRIQCAAFYTPAAWISGAVIYGYPEGRNHPQALPKTEAILDFAFERMMAQPGPRFLAGDWNFSVDTLAVVPKLRAAGWVEIQDLQFSRTGRPPEFTCKGVSRKDHLWVSPELALGFLDLRIDHEVFADHSVLIAQFVGGVAQLERFTWPCPKPVKWPQTETVSAPVDFGVPHDPTAQYAELWLWGLGVLLRTFLVWGGSGQTRKSEKSKSSC